MCVYVCICVYAFVSGSGSGSVCLCLCVYVYVCACVCSPCRRYAAPNRRQAQRFVRVAYNQLFAWHEHLFESWLTPSTGLTAVWHPWSTLMPAAPVWRGALSTTVQLPCQFGGSVPSPPPQVSARADWMGDAAWARAACAVECAVAHRYNPAAVTANCPFMVHSVALSTVLAQATADLYVLAQFVEDTNSRHVRLMKKWRQTSASSVLLSLYDLPAGWFFDRTVDGRRLGGLAAVNLLPLSVQRLLSDAAAASAAGGDAHIGWALQLVNTLFSPSFQTRHIVPSLAATDSGFRANTSMAGPVWLRVNQFMHAGLSRGPDPYVAELFQHASRSLACAACTSPQSCVQFVEAFDANSGRPLQHSTSCAGAGLQALVFQAPPAEFPPEPLIGYTAVVSMMVLELGVVGCGGLVFVIVSLRTLRQLTKDTALLEVTVASKAGVPDTEGSSTPLYSPLLTVTSMKPGATAVLAPAGSHPGTAEDTAEAAAPAAGVPGSAAAAAQRTRSEGQVSTAASASSGASCSAGAGAGAGAGVDRGVDRGVGRGSSNSAASSINVDSGVKQESSGGLWRTLSDAWGFVTGVDPSASPAAAKNK